MADEITLNISPELREQLVRVAEKIGRTPASVVADILEQELPCRELMADFVREALASEADVEAGGPVYTAEDVHAWLERLTKGEKPSRPMPWRK